MPHTLKAYYFQTTSAIANATTLDFLSGINGSSGFAINSYQMGIPSVWRRAIRPYRLTACDQCILAARP